MQGFFLLFLVQLRQLRDLVLGMGVARYCRG